MAEPVFPLTALSEPQRVQALERFPIIRPAKEEDFTDWEAAAAILRITRGNIRLIERLIMQVEHILVANQLQVVTAEVVETAHENLVIEMN